MQALQVIKTDTLNGTAKIHAEMKALPVPKPGPGQVLIKARYSSVNYKDALAATGAGKIMKQLPCVGGVDVAGHIEVSLDVRFVPGDAVLVTGYGLGVECDGGFAEYVCVPADWVVPLPAGLSPLQAMALGTAGFTAALAVMRMEHMGLTPAAGPVVVTGATGGLGSLAIEMLAQRGYAVTAISGKPEQEGYLRTLGAQAVLHRQSLEMSTRPLEKAQWAGAIDTVGGALLAWLTRSMAYRGVIAACGLAGGVELNTTVMPFILRGVSMLGIDSVACPMKEREQVWARLASDLRPGHLQTGIARVVELQDLPAVFQAFMDGTVTGRVVVDVSRG